MSRSGDTELEAQVFREIFALGRLDHDHVVRVFRADRGECRDTPHQLELDNVGGRGCFTPIAPMDTLVDCGTLDVCHGDCVDTLTDPLNCGACDRTCVIAQGVPACSDGSCTLEACEEGWSGCDDDLANGCEAAISCDEGAACLSSCGTTGSITCGDGCEPSCLPPAEVCNAEDDDCHGSCDDGPLPGCRVGIHRAHGPLGHDYGPDAAEHIGRGGTIEATDYFHLYGAATAGFRPLFRCTKASGKRFLTTSTDCESTGAPSPPWASSRRPPSVVPRRCTAP